MSSRVWYAVRTMREASGVTVINGRSEVDCAIGR